ncbi:MAG: hypothetical protein KAW92_13920 [Candidatus Cloacimonetes bacterium]|nr:hypothetical protein [Candidatus Cloacimonadota bacterium]
MKNCLLIILFVLSYNTINSFSLYNELERVVGLPQPSLFFQEQKNGSSFISDYYDIYHYNKDDYKIILENSHICFHQQRTISNFTAKLNLCKRNGYYFINDIDRKEDKAYINQDDIFLSFDFVYQLSKKTKFKLYLEKTNKIGSLLGLEKQIGHHQFLIFVGIRYNRHKLEYDIHNLSSYFPFGYAIIDKKVGYKNQHFTSTLTHQQIISDKNNSDKYPSDITGKNIKWDNGWFYKNYILRFFVSEMSASAYFEYKDQKFCKLDKFSLFFARFNVEKKIRNYDFIIGSEYYKFSIGDDSYFDIWPFSAWTAIYDFDRIRFKELNFELIQPFIQLEKIFQWVKTKNKLSFNYSHLFFDNNYFYKKREIIFGIPMYTKDYKGSFDLEIDAIVELKYDLFYPINNKFNIRFLLSQKIPIDYNKLRRTAGDGVSDEPKLGKNKHGGTMVSLTLNYIF